MASEKLSDEVRFEPDHAGRASAHEIVRRYRQLSIGLIAASILAAIIVDVIAAIQVTPSGTSAIAAVLAGLLLSSTLLSRPSGLRRYAADVAGTIGISVLAGICGSALALLGLALQFPLADRALHFADHLFRFDAVGIVELMSWQQPWFFRLMSWGYHYVFEVLIFTMVALPIFNRVEGWRVALCFTGTLLTICVIATFLPAKGIGVWTPEPIVQRLPGCSMRCFWSTFDTFYQGSNATLALKNIDGVISFPSFHAAMGCTVLAAWRTNLVTLFLASIWFCFLMLGTLPYGGHYGIDLLAGCLVWFGWFILSKRLEQSKFGSNRYLKSKWS